MVAFKPIAMQVNDARQQKISRQVQLTRWGVGDLALRNGQRVILQGTIQQGLGVGQAKRGDLRHGTSYSGPASAAS